MRTQSHQLVALLIVAGLALTGLSVVLLFLPVHAADPWPSRGTDGGAESLSSDIFQGGGRIWDRTLRPANELGRVAGSVSDAWTHRPLTATVELIGVYSVTATPTYVIWAPAGIYSLTAYAASYVTATRSVTITAAELLTVNLALRPSRMQVYLPILCRNLCPLLYADDFSDPGSGWPAGDNGNIRREFLNGEYRILIREPGWIAISRPGYQASHFVLAVEIRNASGSYGSYGLVFGLLDDYSQFYTFEIDPDGYYGILRYQAGSGWALLASGSSPHINTGSASNRLQLMRDGILIQAYANGHALTSVADGSYLGMRHIGLTATSYNAPNVDVRFDNLTVYPAPCGLAVGDLSHARNAQQKATGRAQQPGEWQEEHSRPVR